VTSSGSIEDTGKGKARDVTQSMHVHFGGIDGSGDAHQHVQAKQARMTLDAKKVVASFIEKIEHQHRSLSMGATPPTFFREFPCDDELMSCLAYRRMVFENMGSQRGSVSTMASDSTRRKSEA
jgi:hypothetical protein